MNDILFAPHRVFEEARTVRSDISTHTLDPSNLVLLRTYESGWSGFRSRPPTSQERLVYAYIIDASDPEYLDIQLIYPALLTAGRGCTLPCRFYRLMKADKTIKIFTWEVQALQRDLKADEPHHGTTKTRWELVHYISPNIICGHCEAAPANVLTKCGLLWCENCVRERTRGLACDDIVVLQQAVSQTVNLVPSISTVEEATISVPESLPSTSVPERVPEITSASEIVAGTSKLPDCVICLDATICETETLSCGHQVLCSECSVRVQTCPLCRKSVTVIRLYRA